MFVKKTKISNLLICFTLVFICTGCEQEQTEVVENLPRPVKMIKLSDIFTENIKKYPAKVSANREVPVSFQVAGKLVAFPVKPGDHIKKGDIIGKVDDRDFLSQKQLAQAEYDLATTNFSRYQQLLEKEMISKAQYDSARANLKATQANLRLAKDRIKDSTVYSPFDGVISETLVEKHQYIESKKTIVFLQNNKLIDIDIQLPATILFQIQEDTVDLTYQPSVTFSGDDNKHYPVTYKQHATQVTPGTQSYKVSFTLPTPKDFIIYPGMPATIHIDFNQILQESELSNYIALPLTAVIKDDATDSNLIWLYDEKTHKVHSQVVEMGKITGHSVLVKAEVKADQRVISAGLNQLREGMEVVPLTLERGL